MARRLLIKAADVQVTAQLKDTTTAQAIWDDLPITGSARTWGDEIYFPISVATQEEDPQEVVSMGDIAYWPPGKAFCIFFGLTPASQGDEIRPASPVNVIGSIECETTVLRRVPAGAEVILQRARQ